MAQVTSHRVARSRRWTRGDMVAAVRPDVQRVAQAKPSDAVLPPDPGYHTRHEPHGAEDGHK